MRIDFHGHTLTQKFYRNHHAILVFLTNKESLCACQWAAADTHAVALLQKWMRFDARSSGANLAKSGDLRFRYFAGVSSVFHQPTDARRPQDVQLTIQAALQKQVTREERQDDRLIAVLPTMHGPVNRQEHLELFSLQQTRGTLFVLMSGVDGVPCAGFRVTSQLTLRLCEQLFASWTKLRPVTYIAALKNDSAIHCKNAEKAGPEGPSRLASLLRLSNYDVRSHRAVLSAQTNAGHGGWSPSIA